jgi:hypothetical protein
VKNPDDVFRQLGQLWELERGLRNYRLPPTEQSAAPAPSPSQSPPRGLGNGFWAGGRAEHRRTLEAELREKLRPLRAELYRATTTPERRRELRAEIERQEQAFWQSHGTLDNLY